MRGNKYVYILSVLSITAIFWAIFPNIIIQIQLNKFIVSVFVFFTSLFLIRLVRMRKEFFTHSGDDERMLRLAIENVEDGVIITDKKGNILDCNKKVVSIFQTTKEKVLNSNVQHLIRLHPQSGGDIKFPELFKEIINDKKSFSLKHLVLDIPNSQKSIEIEDSISPIIGKNGRAFGTIIIFRDITSNLSIKNLNDSLVRKIDQLERVDVLGNFLFGVAHNFGDLIVSISSSIQLLRKNLGEEYDEIFNKLDSKIMESKDFIRKLMIFNSSNEFEVVPIELNRLIKANRTFLLKILPKGVEINVELKSTKNVKIDILDFDRIFISIVSSIIDFLDGDDEVFISTYDNDDGPFLEFKFNKAFTIRKYDISKLVERNNLKIIKEEYSVKILF